MASKATNETTRPTATSTTTASSGPSANGEAFFNSVLSGEKVPFNPTVKANQISRMSDMTSAAEGATNNITSVIQTILAAQLVSKSGIGEGK